jgi:signal transduction histidine kinase
MDRYPNGNVWYIHDVKGSYFSLKDNVLIQDDSLDTRRLVSTFPGVRQLLFQPMTDPVSLKRLAGCFVWSKRVLPVFSDTTDLPSLRGFLHTLEAEVSRIDAAAAAKQKEAFVSSVSHELSTSSYLLSISLTSC